MPPLLVIGAGGHARVLIDALLIQSATIFGITDPEKEIGYEVVEGVRVLGSDEIIFNYLPDSIVLVNGLGSVKTTTARQKIFELFKSKGYFFERVIHPSAIIARNVELTEGVQIMAGSIIQTGGYIGQNTIVNTGSRVDHDCYIGSHVHLAPGVTLSGGVRVNNGVHIGTGTTVIQGVQIGSNSLVGAGSLVLKDVPENVTVVGTPARVVIL